ncbi:hypothetical protein COP2_023176 [Malus domestica]
MMRGCKTAKINVKLLSHGFIASLGPGHRWRFRNLRPRRRWEQQQWRLKKGAEKDKGWLTGAAEECGRVMKGFLSGSSSIV